MTGRAAVWLGIEALLVLMARTIVYALSPSPLALHFEHAAGGPRLPVVTVVALMLGLTTSTVAVWLASLGVRERRALVEVPLAREPRLDLRRGAARGIVLFAVSCIAFALVESTIHWREGLGWHGLSCLVGPVHRNAIPVLAALSLLAAALAAAVEHVLDWIRRTIAQLRAHRRRWRSAPRRFPSRSTEATPPKALGSVLGARAPPLAAVS